MNNENFTNEAEIRRFLLGESADGEREKIEAKFIADESFFEQINAVEDDLIESYLRGKLEFEDKRKFEKNFSATEKRRRKIEFTRVMLGKFDAERTAADVNSTETAAAKNSPIAALIGFFKTPKLVFGAAFALLIAAFGFWFLIYKTSENPNEIVRNTLPTPVATVQIIQPNTDRTSAENTNAAPNPDQSKNPESNAANIKNINRETPKKEGKTSPPNSVINPVIALFAGNVRSEGKTNLLTLSKKSNGANLQLKLESEDYQNYRAEITNQDGRIVYRTGKTRARKSQVNVFIPAAKLENGDYIVNLYGIKPNGEAESAADFQFRVNRR